VVGLGKSGIASALFLKNRGAKVTVSDAKSEEELAFEIPRLLDHGIVVETGQHGERTFREEDLIVVSPGVPLEVAPLECDLADLGPLEIRQVRRTPEEALFGRLLQTFHYLGYRRPVGEHVKYLVYGRGQPIACLAWSSAPRHLGPRDRFIGWSAAQRRAQIHLLAYNTRYLILPWVKVRHLASHLLGRVARRISDDWQQLYQHPIYLLETFIEPPRFRGICYRAANWLCLGLTTGRGKDDLTHQPNRSLKELWVLPLGRDFRQRLCREDHEQK